LEARWELEEEHVDEQSELDADLADELFDPSEWEAFLDGLVKHLQAQGVDLVADEDSPPTARSAVEMLPEFVRTHISPERFEQFVSDLHDLIEDEDGDDELVRRAEELQEELADRQMPYWQNAAFQRFLFGALMAFVLEETQEFDEDDDDDDDDDDEGDALF
jgi:hypothetical protein